MLPNAAEKWITKHDALHDTEYRRYNLLEQMKIVFLLLLTFLLWQFIVKVSEHDVGVCKKCRFGQTVLLLPEEELRGKPSAVLSTTPMLFPPWTHAMHGVIIYRSIWSLLPNSYVTRFSMWNPSTSVPRQGDRSADGHVTLARPGRDLPWTFPGWGWRGWECSLRDGASRCGGGNCWQPGSLCEGEEVWFFSPLQFRIFNPGIFTINTPFA